MAFEFTSERYGKITKTLPDLIIIILSKEFPLSMGEINKKLKNEFKIGLTFHAIRKSILLLQERKILEKKDNLFLINKKYIIEEKKIIDHMLSNYLTSEKISKKILGKEITKDYESYEFEDLIQLDKFWGEIVLDWARNLKGGDEKIFCFQGPFCWYPFGHLGTESEFLRELEENKIKSFYLITKNSKMDKLAKPFYESFKINYKIKEKENKIAMGVFGEYVIQFEYPKEIYSGLDNLSKNTKVKEINLSDLSKSLKKEAKIKLTLTKNKLISETLRKQITSEF